MRNILISFWGFFGMFIRTIGNFSQLFGDVIQGIGNLIKAIFGFIGKLLNKFVDKVDNRIKEGPKKGKYEKTEDSNKD